ncbi:dedicator of cytokinesis protein 1 [Venturia nashicola]|nr:dedicator of cytokinesis protein 1 [Venturia nashicola]
MLSQSFPLNTIQNQIFHFLSSNDSLTFNIRSSTLINNSRLKSEAPEVRNQERYWENLQRDCNFGVLGAFALLSSLDFSLLGLSSFLGLTGLGLSSFLGVSLLGLSSFLGLTGLGLSSFLGDSLLGLSSFLGLTGLGLSSFLGVSVLGLSSFLGLTGLGLSSFLGVSVLGLSSPLSASALGFSFLVFAPDPPDDEDPDAGGFDSGSLGTLESDAFAGFGAVPESGLGFGCFDASDASDPPDFAPEPVPVPEPLVSAGIGSVLSSPIGEFGSTHR